MATLSELRQRFTLSPGCQLVTPETYLEYLTGRQQWIRADEPDANLAGLLDETTGNRIFVPVEELTRQKIEGPRQLN